MNRIEVLGSIGKIISTFRREPSFTSSVDELRFPSQKELLEQAIRQKRDQAKAIAAAEILLKQDPRSHEIISTLNKLPGNIVSILEKINGVTLQPGPDYIGREIPFATVITPPVINKENLQKRTTQNRIQKTDLEMVPGNTDGIAYMRTTREMITTESYDFWPTTVNDYSFTTQDIMEGPVKEAIKNGGSLQVQLNRSCYLYNGNPRKELSVDRASLTMQYVYERNPRNGIEDIVPLFSFVYGNQEISSDPQYFPTVNSLLVYPWDKSED